MTGAGGARDVTQQVDVGAAQRAVLAHVGDDVAGATVAVEPLQHLPQVAAVGGPPARGEPVAPVGDPHVEAHRDPLAVGGDDLCAPVGVLQRRGAEIHPGTAGGQRPLQGRVVADAAGQLDRDVQLADDAGQQFGVGSAAERGVEIDEVDPLRAVVLPLQRGVPGGRRTRSRYRPRPGQAHGLAVGDVDGGKHEGGREDDHDGHLDVPRPGASRGIDGQPTTSRSQLRSTTAPASPDFSGWNWVAASAPFSTAATKSSPWWAHVTSGGAARPTPPSPTAAPRRSARSRSGCRGRGRRTGWSRSGRAGCSSPCAGARRP